MCPPPFPPRFHAAREARQERGPRVRGRPNLFLFPQRAGLRHADTHTYLPSFDLLDPIVQVAQSDSALPATRDQTNATTSCRAVADSWAGWRPCAPRRASSWTGRTAAAGREACQTDRAAGPAPRLAAPRGLATPRHACVSSAGCRPEIKR